MKRKPQRLVVRKEAVRTLVSVDLKQAAGGDSEAAACYTTITSHVQVATQRG